MRASGSHRRQARLPAEDRYFTEQVTRFQASQFLRLTVHELGHHLGLSQPRKRGRVQHESDGGTAHGQLDGDADALSAFPLLAQRRWWRGHAVCSARITMSRGTGVP